GATPAPRRAADAGLAAPPLLAPATGSTRSGAGGAAAGADSDGSAPGRTSPRARLDRAAGRSARTRARAPPALRPEHRPAGRSGRARGRSRGAHKPAPGDEAPDCARLHGSKAPRSARCQSAPRPSIDREPRDRAAADRLEMGAIDTG